LFDDIEKILAIPCNFLLLQVTQTGITVLLFTSTKRSQINVDSSALFFYYIVI